MLYLPVTTLSGSEIRLPVFASDLYRLCGMVLDAENDNSQLSLLCASSPGVLLYVASRMHSETGVSVACIGSATEFIEESLFMSAIESDALAPVDDLAMEQLEHLNKWRAKPTRKRLAKYLGVVSNLGLSEARKVIKTIFAADFSFERLEFDSRATRNVITSIESSSERFPARQMWLMCAKIQSLQLEFQSELLQKKMQSLKQLAYGASHEINNPLANIATRAQTLMTDEPKRSRRQKLAVIYSQAMRAHEMIADMMLFACPPELNPEPQQVSELVNRVAEEMRRELKEHQVTISIRQYPDVPICECDSTQVCVALKAMFNNALLSIGSEGDIRVQIWRRNDADIAVSVADNGHGVCDDIADQIFDPFFSGREAGRGLGFGLSKAWRIAELHGGKLELQSQCDEGARFVMTLPIRSASGRNAVDRIDNVRAA